MDRRNYQFWRKDLRRLENEATEFDVHVYGTIKHLTLRERLRESIQLFLGSSNHFKEISGWRDLTRNIINTGKGIFF